jgi:ABC-type lipoprotein release transport system permease subunit
MRAVLRDIRYGFRSLIRSPGLAIVATIALTFGLGLTTTMFSIVYGALMKGLPVPEGDRIVAIFSNNPSRGINRNRQTFPDYAELRKQQRSLQSMGAYTTGTVNVSGTGEAERFAP